MTKSQRVVDWLETPKNLIQYVVKLEDFSIKEPRATGAWVMICDALGALKLFPLTFYKYPSHIIENAYGIVLPSGAIWTAPDWFTNYLNWVDASSQINRANVLFFLEKQSREMKS